MLTRHLRFLSCLLLVLLASPVLADDGANHQVRTQQFGSSGGNIKDISKKYCCSGTLGALVKDSAGVNYILSNNHVLARSDKASAGEDVAQPGLIDNACRPGAIVADFTLASPLGSNVDAAIAALRNGAMSSAGSIVDIGPPNSSAISPAINLAVAKSGRTTGLTCGKVQSVNTSVSVQYQAGCASGKKFTVRYTNQVVIAGSGFSAGGDSGSLIVSQSAAMPAALLYAGSSTTTIGNPIGEVLQKVGARLGRTLSIVGSSSAGDVSCPAAAAAGAQDQISPSESARAFAEMVKERHANNLMADEAVLGVGVGADEDRPWEAAIVVYVEHGLAHGRIPREIDGVKTRIVRTDTIRAFGWNQPEAAASCSLQTAAE